MGIKTHGLCKILGDLFEKCKNQRLMFFDENSAIASYLNGIKDNLGKNHSAKSKNVKRTNVKRIWLKKQIKPIILSIFAGFIFWLPLWSFIGFEIAGIIGSALVLTICPICYLLIKKLRSRYYSKSNETKPILDFSIKVFISKENLTSPLGLYALSLIISVGALSIIHNNPFVIISLCYPLSLAILIFMPRECRFYLGFFIGIFGFYWMSLSLRFEDASAFIPPLIVCIGLVYATLFSLLFYFNSLTLRIVGILALGIIHPFGFNWLNPVFFSAYTVFVPSVFSLILIILSLCLLVFKGKISLLSIPLLVAAYDYDLDIVEDSFTKNKIVSVIPTNYKQDYRWKIQNQEKIIDDNFAQIDRAIEEGYQMVLLPETSFPFLLNKNEFFLSELLERSENIVILVGSLRLEEKDEAKKPFTKESNSETWKRKVKTRVLWGINNNSDRIDSIVLDLSQTKMRGFNFANEHSTKKGTYNSYYIFSQGSIGIADKVALVPFGEKLPFGWITEEFLRKLGIQSPFNEAEKLVSIKWRLHSITIANCYEATLPLPYQTGAKHIFVGSNNAWFYPSSQYHLQRMIIKYYARQYGSFVYHATNMTPAFVITPNNGDSDISIPIREI